MRKAYIAAVAAIATLVIIVIAIMSYVMKDDGIETVADEKIEATELVLDSIRAIGEWQLATVDINATVDTTRSRWLGIVKDHLSRRYYGRMSLGIDMTKLPDDWSRHNNDTIWLTLPDVCLLDSNFIDESMTQTLKSDNEDFEQDSKVKAAMLATARRKMLHNGLTPEAMDKARQQAHNDLAKRFTQIGYNKIIINN